MTKLILLRHGESLANRDHDVYEQIPTRQIPLTEKGVRQARQVAHKLLPHLKNVEHMFVISPYTRTQQTYRELASELAKIAPKLKHTKMLCEEIREWDWGYYQAHKHIPNYNWDTIYQTYLQDPEHYKFPYGESYQDVYLRTHGFVHDTLIKLIEQLSSTATIVCVGHGNQIKCMEQILTNQTFEQQHARDHLDNCDFKMFENHTLDSISRIGDKL